MNNRKIAPKELRLVCIGLLLVTTPLLLNDWIYIPDFIHGILMGTGIGVELFGVIKMGKRLRAGETSC